MVESQAVSEYFVDPISGEDRGAGDRSQPYRTLTHALQQVSSGTRTTIRLQPGRYDVGSGEVFPIAIPADGLVIGNVTGRGEGIEVVGSGAYDSPTFGQQQATLLLTETAQLRGITITNPSEKGTGIWIEAANATIAHCTLIGCGREGILLSGNASPMILNCRFQQNHASGITSTRYAKGEIQRNLFLQNRFGITLSDYAAPLIAHNEVIENEVGLVLSGSVYPVLRHNWIANNRGDGMAVFANARLDLGDRQSPAGNLFQENGAFDVRHLSPVPWISVGNQLHPLRVSGAIEFEGIEPIQSGMPSRTEEGKTREAEKLAQDTSFAPNSDPTDVVGHWALPFIRAVLANRVMGSFVDGTFKPERGVSRAQFATLIVRAFQFPDRIPNQELQDIAANHWAAASIAQAVRMGFMTGFLDQRFCPEMPVSRIAAIAALVQGLGLQGGLLEQLQVFNDRVQIPSQMAQTIAVALQHRLIGLAQPDRLNPLLPVTRAELAVWITQALILQGQISPIESAYLIQPALPAIETEPANRQTQPIVVIDSEQSSHGLPETDVIGTLAQQVAASLDIEDLDVRLTRIPDETIDLEQRSNIAAQANADLLVSLYFGITQSTQPTANGIATYHNPDPLSLRAAQTLHTAILQSIDLPDQGVKPANFDRFSHLSLPVVYLELRFPIAAGDPLSLGNVEFQRYLAAAIVKGILQSLKQ